MFPVLLMRYGPPPPGVTMVRRQPYALDAEAAVYMDTLQSDIGGAIRASGKMSCYEDSYTDLAARAMRRRFLRWCDGNSEGK